MEVLNDSLPNVNTLFDTAKPLLETGSLLKMFQGIIATIFIGLLVGLEREHARPKSEKIFAGIRTFPLISILGFITALLASLFSPWIFAVVFIGFSGLLVSSYLTGAGKGRIGGTSEVSAIIVFILGALVYTGFILLAAVIGIVTTIFLSLKFQLHNFVGKINSEDIFATLKFAIITIIILPLLPDRTFGPLDVLNPKMIWLMVIFISGISYVGYILIKVIGKNRGVLLTGLLGGMVSSTAVTFSMSKKSKENESLSGNYSVGILISSTVMFARVLTIVLVVSPGLVFDLWLPTIIFTLAGLTTSFILFKKVKQQDLDEISLKNPFELKSALLFGLIFAIVIFASRAAEEYLGTGGLYAASALAGLTSVDAITISLSQLSDGVASAVAIKALIIAMISNNLVKIGITFFLGTKELFKNSLFGLGAINGVLLAYLIILFTI